MNFPHFRGFRQFILLVIRHHPTLPSKTNKNQSLSVSPSYLFHFRRCYQNSLDYRIEVSSFWFLSGFPHKLAAVCLKIKSYRGTGYQRRQVATLWRVFHTNTEITVGPVAQCSSVMEEQKDCSSIDMYMNPEIPHQVYLKLKLAYKLGKGGLPFCSETQYYWLHLEVTDP